VVEWIIFISITFYGKAPFKMPSLTLSVKIPEPFMGIRQLFHQSPGKPQNFSLMCIFPSFICRKAEIISPYDDKIPGNPIGTLQEMCMSRRWPPPGYEMVNEEGLPHERLFTIACVVFKHRETG
jgi:hypothetical protein